LTADVAGGVMAIGILMYCGWQQLWGCGRD
jgi:hypothetical protein